MQKVDLLHGNILPSLAKLAFPIMATQLIQMAYNLTDMIWIGRVGSGAVAAVGASGMYLWLANGLATIPRLGGQVKAAHALGSGDTEKAAAYAAAAFRLGAVLAGACTAVYLIFYKPLTAFFRLNDPAVVRDAECYLLVVALGLFFSFFNQIFTGLFTCMGASAVTFRSTAAGLAANIVLDPLFIFGLGPLPALGVAGAAIATVLAQGVVFLLFLLAARREGALFPHLQLRRRRSRADYADILRIGLPVSVQSIFFSSLSMIIARLIAGWGDAAVAVQKVGSQIESISWMTADGFASAVNAFVAQNYGAKQPARIRRGTAGAAALMAGWGLLTGALLVIFPQALFRVFIQEEAVLPMGVDYLRILGYSQLFMCMEITCTGAFQGLGRPMVPTVVSVIFNTARIPMALILSATALSLNGVWWAITLSSILKGLIIPVWFVVILRQYLRREDAGA
ncbi:MAG: MATE family efflux transporter [Ruthenibacterium sp.]